MVDNIVPSPELIAVVRRWHQAVRDKDDAILFNMLSGSEHLRYQGSANDESWCGQVFRDGFPDHVREIPDFDWQESSLEAFECGNVGWAHSETVLTFSSNSKSALHRFTFVLHLENGVWKLVQLHVSNPTSNLDKMGVKHIALNALVEAARQDFHQEQREGTASVMFTDIADSSRITRQMGDQLWTRTISRHLDLAERVIAAHQGRLIKSLGDGTMSIFPSVQDALLAAIDFQRENDDLESHVPLGLRIGIHTGDVIQRDEDFFGTVVNKAARVTDISDPNEIHVSDVTRLLVGGDSRLKFGAPKPVLLKGFGGKHTVYRLDWNAS